MARSLDGLIHHLVDEVALRSYHGASSSDFVSCVRSYYAALGEDSEIVGGGNSSTKQPNVPPNVDRPFLEKVWKWLMRNPEIRLADHTDPQSSILSGASRKNWTLSDVERHNAAIKSAANPRNHVRNDARKKVAVLAEEVSNNCNREDLESVQIDKNPDIHDALLQSRATNEGETTTLTKGARLSGVSIVSDLSENINHNAKDCPGDIAQQGKGTESTDKRKDCYPGSSKSMPKSLIRLYTSESRMWYALSGHGPDPTRIKGRDFECLSVIGACGRKGIYQHDLVRLSGQDGKSLPARTERLSVNGYIEKTRICIQESHVDKLLNTSHLVLKRFYDPKQLQQANADAASARDRKGTRKKKKDVSENENKNGAQTAPLAFEDGKQEDQVQPPNRFIPQWTSKRPLANQIHDIVYASGTQGISMSEIRAKLFGEHVRKPQDEYLSRLSDHWQLSQPLSLRHLSIVRDETQKGKTKLFIYYTFEHFKELVETGRRVWKAVTMKGNSVTYGFDLSSSLDAVPQLDEYGFPMLESDLFQGRNNDATLPECVSANRVYGFNLASGDPVLKRHADGTFGIQYRAARRGPNAQHRRKQSPEATHCHPLPKSINISSIRSQSSRPSSELFISKTKRPRNPTQVKQGRPRKFPKAGTEDFTNMTPAQIKSFHTSQKRAEQYSRGKLEDEINRRIQEGGGDAAKIAREVLEVREAEEGGEPLLNYSKEIILHKYAGGPMPTPQHADPMSPRRGNIGKGRRKRQYYWPSMAAHTIPIPRQSRKAYPRIDYPQHANTEAIASVSRVRRLPAHLRDSENDTNMGPPKKRSRRQKEVTLISGRPYLPSTAAHSWPYILPPSANGSLVIKAKRRPGRPPKSKNCASLPTEAEKPAQFHLRYLPSIAAHSPSFLPSHVPPPTNSRKRKRTSSILVQHDRSPPAPENQRAPLVTAITHPPQEVPQLLPSSTATTGPEGLYPGWKKFMSKYYGPALRDIQRPHEGVFLGEIRPRRKRNNEPAGFRPRIFRLVVFKFARLHEVNWSVSKVQNLEQTQPRNDHTQSLQVSHTGASHHPTLEQELTFSQLRRPIKNVLMPHSSLPLTENLYGYSESGHVSKDTSTNSKKRRRKESDDLERAMPSENTTSEQVYNRGSFSSHMIPSTDSVQKHLAPPALEMDPQAGETSATHVAESLDTNSVEPSIPMTVSPSVVAQGISCCSPLKATTTMSPQTTHDIHDPSPSANSFSHITPAISLPAVDSVLSYPTVPTNTTGEPSSCADATTSRPLGLDDESSLNNLQQNHIDGVIAQSGRNGHEETVSRISSCSDTGPNKLREINDDNMLTKMPVSPREGGQVIEKGDGTLEHNLLLPQRLPLQTNTASERQTSAKMGRNEGTISLLRKDIVMHLMHKSGGVLGFREMSKPFASEWQARGMSGTPEEATIKNAINALNNESKLLKIDFTFQDKKGRLVRKIMLRLPSIDVTDSRVRNLQTNMMAQHPRHFIPSALLPPENPLSTGPTISQGQKINDGKDRFAQATLASLQEEEQRQLQQKWQRNSNKDGMPGDNDENHEPIRKVPLVPYQSPSHSTRVARSKRSMATREDRLTGVKISRKQTEKESGLPSLRKGLSMSSSSLMWLPTEYAFSDFNFEEERPTVREPTISGYIRHPHERYGTCINAPEPAKSLQTERPVSQKTQRLMPLATNKVSSLPSGHDSVSGSDEEPEHTESVHKRRRVHSLLDDPMQRSLSGAKLSSCEKPFAEQPSKSQSRQKKVLVSFVNATHYFHQSTGTFSVNFCGLEAPRQIINKIGTCTKPYSLGPRNFHPDFPVPRSRRYILPKRPFEAADTQFEQEVDDLLKRELETEDLMEVDYEDLPFVNHTLCHAHTTVEAVEAKMNTMKEVFITSKGGRIHNRRFPGLNADRRKTDRSIFSRGARNISAKAAEALKRIDIRGPPKRRRLALLVEDTSENEPQSRPIEAGRPDKDGKLTKIRRVRGPREPWRVDDAKRLLTAVIVVRTLTGGLEKRIDWVLVAKAFDSTQPQEAIEARWKYVLQKYKPMVLSTESDFQDMFAEAYEKGTIPSLDFDNLLQYDWKWLTEWTLRNRGMVGKAQPDLPAVRAQFDDLYMLDDTSDVDINDYYEINGIFQSAPRRTTIANGTAYVYKMDQEAKERSSQKSKEIDIARTWIRANVITSESTYMPEVARAKLATLPEEAVEGALKQLLLDKVLSQQNKGRLVPHRNYDISESFLSRLKKNLQASHFQRAIAFKLHLDREFAQNGGVAFSATADDGDMLAIINLLANKRILIKPSNVPLNKWGQTDGNYQSRQMDRSRLNFDMHLHPSPTYINGNPLLPLPEPPAPHLGDEPMTKIPLWYDIHDSLVPIMWDMALAAVMAVLAVRPGIDAKETEIAIKPAMEAWELQLVLQWLVDVRAAVEVGTGYTTGEWWWLAFGGESDARSGVSGGQVRVEEDGDLMMGVGEDGHGLDGGCVADEGDGVNAMVVEEGGHGLDDGDVLDKGKGKERVVEGRL